MGSRHHIVVKRINFHTRIKKYLILFSYFFIVFAFFMYIFEIVNKKKTAYKIISDYKENKNSFDIEKTMTNPRIKFQHNDDNIYFISAKKAFHKNQEKVNLESVEAVGNAGTIKSGKLFIEENGSHLVFTENPILILNNTENE